MRHHPFLPSVVALALCLFFSPSAQGGPLNSDRDWESSHWGDKQKKEYQESLRMFSTALRHQDEMRTFLWSEPPPKEDFHSAFTHHPKRDAQFLTDSHNAFKWLGQHSSYAAWQGFFDACKQRRPKSILSEVLFRENEDWAKQYAAWWASRPRIDSVFMTSLCPSDAYLDAFYGLKGNEWNVMFTKFMETDTLTDVDKVWFLLDRVRYEHKDDKLNEDAFLALMDRWINDPRILLWNHMTVCAVFEERPPRPAEDASPKERSRWFFAVTKKKYPLPIANFRMCDAAAKLIAYKYSPFQMHENLLEGFKTWAMRECGPTEKLTTWPGWKKMPAMQDEYVAKAKAWLDAYKQKRTAIQGLRAILRNPQIVELDAKTWQSSWESLVLLEAQAPGYSDQRFYLLAEAFLREAMNPKAKDRQMRQSCILGQLQQMWLDAKQPLDSPAADALVKPQAALDFLEAALAQLTPPLAKDPTAKMLWEYKVKDWRKEWNGKLEEFSKPPEKHSPNISDKK